MLVHHKIVRRLDNLVLPCYRVPTMYNSFQGKRSGGSAGGKKFSTGGTWNRAGGGRPAPKELHDAICSECRKPCQVPFFPAEGRPVKCRDCFKSDYSGNDSGFAPRDDRRPAFDRRPSFDREDRRDDRPSYAPREDRSSGNVEARLASIERKLDNLLELLDADEEVAA